MSCGDLFLGLLAILFPPIAVWIKTGLCSADSLINILLCVLGYIPGLIHAWYIIAKHPEPDAEYEPIDQENNGNGRVTYYYVSHEPNRRAYGTQAGPKPNAQSKPKPKLAAQPGNASAGEGSAQGQAPPSYQEVVAGDHKVQSQG